RTASRPQGLCDEGLSCATLSTEWSMSGHETEEAAAGVAPPHGGAAVSDLNTVGQEALAPPDADIVVRRLADGQGRPGEVGVDLLLAGRAISTCALIPLTLRIGAATV